MSANGSSVFGLTECVGVLWTEPVGLVVADRLPIPKPAPEHISKQKRKQHNFKTCPTVLNITGL